MVEQEYIELMNRQIDGEISPAEGERLNAYLEKNPDAKNLYHDLVNMSVMLDEVEERDPPPHLEKNILNALPVKKYAPREKQNIFESLFGNLVPKTNFRFAYTFAAGLVAGFLGFALWSSNLFDGASLSINDLKGAIVFNDPNEKFETVGKFDLNQIDLSGLVQIVQSSGVILAKIDLQTIIPTEVVCEFDKEEIRFSGFLQQSDQSHKLTITDSYVRLTHIGENKYTFLFDKETSSVRRLTLRIVQSGAVLFERTVIFESGQYVK